MKIKNKLTLLFTLSVGGLLLFFSIFIFFFYSQYRMTEFKERLSERAHFEADLLWKIEKGDINKMEDDNRNISIIGEELIEIYQNNNLIFQSHRDKKNIPPVVLKKIYKKKEFYFQFNDLEYFGKVFRNGNQDYVILVGAYDKYGHSKLNVLEIILVVGFISFILIIFGLGRFFANKAFKPIENIIVQVDKIGVSNIGNRVKLDDDSEKDEVHLLASTFNKMLQRLQHAFEMQKSFVSNASHELRTPMAIVKGQLQVALMQDRDNEEYKKVMNSILFDLERYNGLLDRLLQLAQTDLDSSNIRMEKIRIDELILNSIQDCKNKYPKCEISFEFENEPENEDCLIVNANEMLLKTAILNVIDNASKYSNGLLVRVLLDFKEVWTVIKVLDSGIGIPEEQIEKIMEPFYRAGNVNSISGHGIGLYLAAKIIKIHKGYLRVYSNINYGTRVFVSIPSISNINNKNLSEFELNNEKV